MSNIDALTNGPQMNGPRFLLHFPRRFISNLPTNVGPPRIAPTVSNTEHFRPKLNKVSAELRDALKSLTRHVFGVGPK